MVLGGGAMKRLAGLRDDDSADREPLKDDLRLLVPLLLGV